MRLKKYLKYIRVQWAADGSWYISICSIYVPLHLRGYEAEGKLNFLCWPNISLLKLLLNTEIFLRSSFYMLYIRMWKSCKSLIFLLNRWFVCMCLFKVKTSDLLKSLSKRIRIERILLKKNVYNQRTGRNAKELSVVFTP